MKQFKVIINIRRSHLILVYIKFHHLVELFEKETIIIIFIYLKFGTLIGGSSKRTLSGQGRDKI